MTPVSPQIKPILEEFDLVANLARTNSYKNFNNNDLVLGIMYGDFEQLNAHYLKINQRYPVIIGKDFWHRLTGYPQFYPNLIAEIDKSIERMDANTAFNDAYNKLLKDIRSADLL